MDIELPAADLEPPVPTPVPAERTRPPIAERLMAAIEVLLCSDYPTQRNRGTALVAFGIHVQSPDVMLNPEFVVVLSLPYTAFLVSLITQMHVLHGHPRLV